jgi:hypothetical protein
MNHSDADQALASKLAYWTQRNVEQSDRIFRLSGLYDRAKCVTMRGALDYVRYTIERACKKQKAVWMPTAPREPSDRRKGGRPRSKVQPEQVYRLRAAGKSWREIGTALGIGKTSAARLYDAHSGVLKPSQNSSGNSPVRELPPTSTGGVEANATGMVRPSVITVVVTGEAGEEELSWAEWKARSLNRLFAELGTGGPGRILAETVAHGEKMTRSM